MPEPWQYCPACRRKGIRPAPQCKQCEALNGRGMTLEEWEELLEANRTADRERLVAEGANILDTEFDDGTTPRSRR